MNARVDAGLKGNGTRQVDRQLYTARSSQTIIL